MKSTSTLTQFVFVLYLSLALVFTKLVAMPTLAVVALWVIFVALAFVHSCAVWERSQLLQNIDDLKKALQALHEAVETHALHELEDGRPTFH